MVWDHFSKTEISLPLVIGFKHVIYQMKGDIFLYHLIKNRTGMNLNSTKYELKTFFSLLFFEPRFQIYYHNYNFAILGYY